MYYKMQPAEGIKNLLHLPADCLRAQIPVPVHRSSSTLPQSFQEQCTRPVPA